MYLTFTNSSSAIAPTVGRSADPGVAADVDPDRSTVTNRHLDDEAARIDRSGEVARPHETSKRRGEAQRAASATRKCSIIEFTCAGTSSWVKCPAPTVQPVVQSLTIDANVSTGLSGGVAGMWSTRQCTLANTPGPSLANIASQQPSIVSTAAPVDLRPADR